MDITEEQTSSNHNDTQKYDNNSDDSGDTRFTEGEILKFIRVRFPGNAKSQQFLLGKRTFVYGQKVLAMSDRGMTVGYINSFPYELAFEKSMLPIRTISRVAHQEDIEEQKSYYQKEKDAEVLCKRLIEKHELNMNVTHVEFIQFGKKSVFYFTAPERVDFRALVKDLVGELKMRIELRQISVRDRAAALGATGACGLQTCCSSFLSNYGNVSIKMAKNQNLALIPSKINGVCGQIKCCIKYEDDVYSAKRKLLPREQSYIRTKNGDLGKVIKLHLILEQFEMLTDKGNIRRYDKSQFRFDKSKTPSDWSFPTEFRSIVRETDNVIGLDDEKEKQMHIYEDDIPDDEIDSIGEEAVLEDDDDVVIEDVVIEKEKLDESLSDDDIIREEKKDNRSNNNRRNNKSRRPNNNKNDRSNNRRPNNRNNNRSDKRNDNRDKKPHEAKASGDTSENKSSSSQRYRGRRNRNNSSDKKPNQSKKDS
jgi:cell fate regulator YaaT (PSP1 superfamily)